MQTSLVNRLRPAQKLVLPLNVGLWRSLVARPSGGRKVAGSSPASPTKQTRPLPVNGWRAVCVSADQICGEQ